MATNAANAITDQDSDSSGDDGSLEDKNDPAYTEKGLDEVYVLPTLKARSSGHGHDSRRSKCPVQVHSAARNRQKASQERKSDTPKHLENKEYRTSSPRRIKVSSTVSRVHALWARVQMHIFSRCSDSWFDGAGLLESRRRWKRRPHIPCRFHGLESKHGATLYSAGRSRKRTAPVQCDALQRLYEGSGAAMSGVFWNHCLRCKAGKIRTVSVPFFFVIFKSHGNHIGFTEIGNEKPSNIL